MKSFCIYTSLRGSVAKQGRPSIYFFSIEGSATVCLYFSLFADMKIKRHLKEHKFDVDVINYGLGEVAKI